MKTLFTFFLLFSTSIFAQENFNYNLKISYDINFNTELPNSKKGTLYINELSSKSLFVYGQNKDKNISLSSDDDNTFIIKENEIVKFNYLNLLNDSLFTKEKVSKDEFLIEERKPRLKWKLIDEEKEIDTFIVYKATLNFRGRNYIAWYSTMYPVQFGPWKFHGLPGLILEIYDETKRYHWITTSIETKETESINIQKLIGSLQRITVQNFVEKRYNKKNDLVNKTRLPRGAIVAKEKISRNGIEIKFEWEAIEEKKD